MLLTPDEMMSAVYRLSHLSCGARPLDKYLSALALDPLRAFNTRAIMLFGLEEDLGIEVLASFGVMLGERDRLNSLHLLRESHYAGCLTSGTSRQVPSDDVEVTVAASRHVLFLPIAMRGAAYAGVAIWMADDPQLEHQQYFWDCVASGIGLALTCQWIPAYGKSSNESNPRLVDLTPRQIDILHLVAQGLTNREISRRLNYGMSTIGHELMAIFRVLRVETRAEASREAARRGLLFSSVQPVGLESRLIS